MSIPNPVYVVGYGIIDGLGNNSPDCFSNMIVDRDFTQDLHFMVDRGEKHHRGIFIDKDSLSIPKISPKLLKTFTKSQLFAFHSTDQALKMFGPKKSDNVAVIFSSIVSNLENINEYSQNIIQNKRVNPRHIINRISDMVPSQICNYYGFMGPSVSVHASCATGLYTLEYAQRLCDEYDYVIVGCADANIFYQFVKEFSIIGSLGNYNCPFDDKRDGFIMGEGSGCLIIQSKTKVDEYGSKIYAKLYPAGCASDALDMTSPAPDGRGAKIAISKALKNAEHYSKNPIEIDAVSAHATSTIIGDPIEYDAITEYLKNALIYAPKSKIGHTLGSAGILETIYAIESMRNNIIPHCQNLVNCSFDIENILVKEPTKYSNSEIKRTLNNSFAFGGKCISQVIEINEKYN